MQAGKPLPTLAACAVRTRRQALEISLAPRHAGRPVLHGMPCLVLAESLSYRARRACFYAAAVFHLALGIKESFRIVFNTISLLT